MSETRGLIRFVANGLRWRVHADHEAWVRESLGPVAENPERLSGAEVVKHNRIRTVARVPGPQGLLFCKRHRILKTFDRWLHVFKASPADREWRALRRFTEAGLLCPEPVILGEERRGGRLLASVLATREVPAQELTHRIDALRASRGPEREALVARLAEVVWRIFQAGGDHPDLHIGNFLEREDGELVVLDLHSVRLKGAPLGARLRSRRLGKLAHSFGPTNPDTRAAALDEVRWFARAYAERDTTLGPADALVERMLAAATRLEARRLRSRDRRCLVDSTGFVVERHQGSRIYRRRTFAREAVLEALGAESLATIHAHPRGRSRIESVAAPSGVSAERVIRKLYLFPSLFKRLAGMRNPLPLRAWKAARACEIRHVPVPVHWAFVLEGWLLPRRGTILMELLADVTMIHVLLEREPALAPASRRRLARDFGRLMGRFHASGLKHRDLAVQNILIRPSSGDGRDGWSVWIVDLDEVSTGPMTRKEKLRALIHMGDLPATATRTDRARFFSAYLDAGGRQVLAAELQEWGARGLGQRVAHGLDERAQAKARRQAQRVRKPAPTDLSALA